MSSYDRVYIAHRLTAYDGAAGSRVRGLLVAGVHCLEAVEALAELGRETLVCYEIVSQVVGRSCWRGLLTDGHISIEGIAPGRRTI